MTTNAVEQLMQAAYDGNLNSINEALKNGASVNARGQFGDTALNEAAEHGHMEFLDLGRNKITKLPSTFWGLKNLKSLRLSGNKISKLLPDIKKL